MDRLLIVGRSQREIDGFIIEEDMDAIEILKDLIRINTSNPPGNEREAAVYIDRLLKGHGFHTTMQELGNNRANLIAWIGKEEGPELVFDGHLDVVPALGSWSTNPFEPVVKDNLLYGRGSCDMKGGVAAMIAAAIRIQNRVSIEKELIHGKLKLLFVADEEDANLGMHEYQKEFMPGKYCIIGEPTELRVAAAHRGVSRDYVLIYGKPRHAALKPLTEDSISKTGRFINCIKELNQILSKKQHPVLPPPSIAITSIKGYEKDNIVPGTVEALLDFRILPGMSHKEVLDILNTALRKIFMDDDFDIKPHFYMPGGEINVNDPFVKIGLDAVNSISDQTQEKAISFGASCEQCFLSEKNVKTIILGPGSLRQAHGDNEFTSIKEVIEAVDIYEKIASQILF